MDFEQRRESEPSQSAGVGDGVAEILAAYGVEPSQKGARPEVEDDEDENKGWTPPIGSSGVGGGSNYKYRAAFREGGESREALINKYPALQNGLIR
ncbi:hypothetical protein [Actinomycetospora cinnamomea]|uniref:Uncharacterized protein n=1 Tax=Actinomycetospora cinnamomea TaxID=663609 RepID=A0A2U1FDW2_9PSEU|nr:hypothetical protein [Actinomycetospora cinnamomea]PVZ10150.1 hypothetical protein C8D89_105227 [Actinomycetospora cinnamomea]